MLNFVTRISNVALKTLVAALLLTLVVIPATSIADAAYYTSGTWGWESFSTGSGSWYSDNVWNKWYNNTPSTPEPTPEPAPQPTPDPEPDPTPEFGDLTVGTLAKGYKHETKYYLYDSGIPGPTVAVIGGMHGNETAGYRAARVIKDWTVKSGRLLVIPEINKPAVESGTRTSPIGDLNRHFPRTSSDSADSVIGREVFKLMEKLKPDYLVDLHEGYDFHLINSKSVGQTVIYYPKGNAGTMAKAMTSEMSKTVSKSSHRFTTLKYPISGSLARSVSIRLKTIGMIVETSNKQTLSLRIQQHQTAIRTLLTELGMY